MTSLFFKTYKKKLCLIQANCIGHPLRDFLMMAPAFAAIYDVKIYTNYTSELIPDSELRTCNLFIHQYLDEKWNDLASSVLTAKVNSGRCISIPSCFWRILWPFWTWDYERMKPEPGFPFGKHPYGDSFVLKKLKEGVSRREIINAYLEMNINEEVDMEAIFAEDYERECARERHLDVKISDYVAANFRNIKLMTSVNHPTNVVILKIANSILGKLDIAAVPEEISAAATEFGEYQVPIHPAVIRHYRLSFVDEDSRYLMNGKMRTFSEYVEDYLDNK